MPPTSFASCASRGFQAYFAGGCVRDMLLGLEPADYDVATDATPHEVMRIFPETYAVGAQFGVVLVPLKTSPKQKRLGLSRRKSHPGKGWMRTVAGHPAVTPSEHPN